MSELESIGKLREWSRLGPMACKDTLDIADEIEAEIAEKYIELPVDADGVPIRVGDKVTWDCGKPAVKFTIDTFAFDMEHGEWDVKDSNYLNIFPAHRCRHVKPRTVEDVLDDYRRELVTAWRYTPDDGLADVEDETTARYADEIRAMFGEVDR